MSLSIVNIGLPASIAHVKWFPAEGTLSVLPISTFEAISIAVLLGLTLVALWQVRIRIRGYEAKVDRSMRRFSRFVPLAVGATAGLGLIFASLSGHFLAPNLEVHNGAILQAALVAQLAVGVSWVSGIFTRYTAGFFLLLFALGFLFVPPIDLVDHLELVGAPLYLAVCGRQLPRNPGSAWIRHSRSAA